MNRRWLLALYAACLALFWVHPALADDMPNDLEHKSPIEMWEIVVGFAIPAVVQLVKQYQWDDEIVRLVAIVCAVVSTAVGMALAGNFDNTKDWPVTLMTVIITSQVAYEVVWKSKLLAALTARLGSTANGPSQQSQRMGYQGETPNTPPPSGS